MELKIDRIVSRTWLIGSREAGEHQQSKKHCHDLFGHTSPLATTRRPMTSVPWSWGGQKRKLSTQAHVSQPSQQQMTLENVTCPTETSANR